VGLAAASALGAPSVLIFEDDFEGQNLVETDVPPGRWTSLDVYPSTSVATAASAAHRGDAGLRVVDLNAPSGPGNMSAVYRSFDGGGTLALRYWLRVSGLGAVGSALLSQLFGIGARKASVCELTLAAASGSFQLEGDDGPGTFQQPTGRVADGGWALVECRASGLRSDAGQVQLWLDGSLAAQRAGLDFALADPTVLGLGQPFSDDRRFIGVLEFDDVRLDTQLGASSLRLNAPGQALTNSCVALQLVAVTSEGAPATLDAPARIVATAVGGALFRDSACQVGLGALTLSPGAAGGTFWLQSPTPVDALVAVQADDLLGNQALVMLREPTDAGAGDAGFVDGGAPDAGAADAGLPDAGASDSGAADSGAADAGAADAGPADSGRGDAGVAPAGGDALTVGCGCSSAQGPTVALLLGALLLRRRRVR
jgi:MYXO-CTERM domain-containing protein